ncbi:MAG: U32 family peptidase [Chitinophagales bacterium]|nr:U32 family peptidase [Chitinophagales bacterium]MCO5279464.1 U32 family peptidase [Chitinophagales bacterium]OJV24424.1 MAG: collagenase [Bacteroidetes bacterium 37-13]HRN94981.1 peptidase U32 family protein [Chitinophagales bacterium]HRP39318.1 peptidase U32 family protein [Chitinophagales bacterium]
MKKSKLEIMAPAGSWEAMMAAIKAGADSIYFGIEQLNMRARSTNNFFLSDLKKIAETCAAHDVKSYLTLNTIIYDHDISLMRKIVDEAKASGITAIIASDLAVLNYSRKQKMPVHISTQANVTNIETIEFFADYADVMVMSRELTLQQVTNITQKIERRNIVGPSGEPIRIEIFGHGALCMAVSGKCYISLHTHNASANRGACIQNCRRSYVVTDKEEGHELEIDNEYIMSAKDLCTIDFLDKIIEAGVSVLKIEGRGRSAEYVYTTTKCYREAAEAIAEGTYTEEKINSWMKSLETVFNRGFWDGYYLGRKIGEWSSVYGSAATMKKVYLGKGSKYYDKIGVAEFIIEAQALNAGDEIIITGPTTGYVEATIEEIRVDNSTVEAAGKGSLVSFKLSEKIRPSDKLYKKISAN